MVKKDPWKYSSLVSRKHGKPYKTRSINRRIAHELVAPELNSENFISQIEVLYRKHIRVNGLRVECNKLGFTAHRPRLRQQLLAVLPHYTRTIHNIIKVFKATLVNVFMSTANSNFRLIIADDGTGADLDKNKRYRA